MQFVTITTAQALYAALGLAAFASVLAVVLTLMAFVHVTGRWERRDADLEPEPSELTATDHAVVFLLYEYQVRNPDDRSRPQRFINEIKGIHPTLADIIPQAAGERPTAASDTPGRLERERDLYRSMCDSLARELTEVKYVLDAKEGKV